MTASEIIQRVSSSMRDTSLWLSEVVIPGMIKNNNRGFFSKCLLTTKTPLPLIHKNNGGVFFFYVQPMKAKAKNGKLEGAKIHFDISSVGATGNVLMAATLAKGNTKITTDYIGKQVRFKSVIKIR